MHKHWLIEKGIPNQTALAKILGDGVVERKHRVRAHRIWHGMVPSDDDMEIIYRAKNGHITPNDFYKLKSKKIKNN